MKNSNKIGKGGSLFNSALFVILLCIIALRLSFTDNPIIESFAIRGTFLDNFLSIMLSSLLIILFLIWFIAGLWHKNYKFHLGALGWGIILFIIASVISTIAASNRRAAINNSLTILSAMLTGVMLLHLLDSIEKRKMLLGVIIAMAVANVYQCSEQFFSSNKSLITQYEQEPNIQLEKLGIEPGSFQQMLYEHRLYSKDVRGFFTTGNSAAGLMNLAVFSTLAVFSFKTSFKKMLLPIGLLLILFAGLIETHSKGAFASLVFAAVLLVILIKFGKFLKQWVKLTTIAAVVLAAVCLAFIMNYGLTHGRLPGGNSMLVRWQYWQGAAQMIAANPLAGIGGGNFGTVYTQYKIPAALETVRDPHCFILSLASQYGIIGLAGFCLALFYPIIKAGVGEKPLIKPAEEKNFAALAKACGICGVLTLLFVRPLFVRVQIGGGITVIIYILMVMYAAPAFFFGITVWLSRQNESQSKNINSQFSTAALVCGILAVIIHNLIDFAIFEPGIMTAIWASAAIVYSQKRMQMPAGNNLKTQKMPVHLSQNKTCHSEQSEESRFFSALTIRFAQVDCIATKYILTATAITAGAALVWFCLMPVANASIKIETANLLLQQGEFKEALSLLSSADKDDKLNPAAAALGGKILMYKAGMTPLDARQNLLEAEKLLEIAAERDNANFKYYQDIAGVYEALAQITAEQRQLWQEKTVAALEQAIDRYPGSGRLHIELAKTAIALNKKELAIEHYQKAVEIEDAYTEQFKIMYPGKDVFSRLGKREYMNAKEKLEELKKIEENQDK
ncbi:MAG: O-antigen ligase family protein [Phycisphaerae bacterium]|nr:O-antigen ligase family protein [Phycisphaerae bacterium]